jgi:hypothetical protein
MACGCCGARQGFHLCAPAAAPYSALVAVPTALAFRSVVCTVRTLGRNPVACGLVGVEDAASGRWIVGCMGWGLGLLAWSGKGAGVVGCQNAFCLTSHALHTFPWCRNSRLEPSYYVTVMEQEVSDEPAKRDNVVAAELPTQEVADVAVPWGKRNVHKERWALEGGN